MAGPGATEPATISELDELFHDALEALSVRRPDLITPGTDISYWFSIYRSLRRGAQSQAINQGTRQDIRNLIARWRAEENAGYKDASLPMPEHYTDLVVALPAFIRYSEQQ